jgi:hypothetical protein
MDVTGTEEKSSTIKCIKAHSDLKHLLSDAYITGVLSENDLLDAYVTINYAILGIMTDREKLDLEYLGIAHLTDAKDQIIRISELNNKGLEMKALNSKTKDLIAIALSFNSLLLEGHLLDNNQKSSKMARAAIRSIAAAYLVNL